jgi:N-acetylated-alpha-linked acidic dipeptidase
VGSLGGGSDHVGFYAHLGIPSASLGGGGSEGVSYHTNYEDLAWYRAVVGEDYAPAAMLTRVVVTLLARVAEADVLPLEPAAYGAGAAERLTELAGPSADGEKEAASPLAVLAARAEGVAARLKAARRSVLRRLDAGTLTPAGAERANRALRRGDRAWVSAAGLPGRPWYRNLYAAPDADSGYAPWVLPGLTAALQAGRGEAAAAGELEAVLGRLEQVASELEAAAAPAPD